MYEKLVKRLREHGEFLIVLDRMKSPPNVNVRNVFAEDYAQAADAIEEMSKLAEAIPHKCKCCIGCEIEQENGGCETGFVLSPERAKAYIEENLDWWRKFRALMEATGMPIQEPPKDEFGKSEQLCRKSKWNLDGSCQRCGKHSLQTYENFCCYCGADMRVEDVPVSDVPLNRVD